MVYVSQIIPRFAGQNQPLEMRKGSVQKDGITYAAAISGMDRWQLALVPWRRSAWELGVLTVEEKVETKSIPWDIMGIWFNNQWRSWECCLTKSSLYTTCFGWQGARS